MKKRSREKSGNFKNSSSRYVLSSLYAWHSSGSMSSLKKNKLFEKTKSKDENFENHNMAASRQSVGFLSDFAM